MWNDEFSTRRRVSIAYDTYKSEWEVTLSNVDRRAYGRDSKLRRAIKKALMQVPVLEIDDEIWRMIRDIREHYRCDLLEAHQRFYAMDNALSEEPF